MFVLKRAIRDTVGKEVQERSMYDELFTLESRIDSLALLAFDIYMQCRERIFEIRADEVRNRTFRLLEQAHLICGVQDDDTGPRDDNNGKEKRKR